MLCGKSVTVFSVLEPDLIYSELFNIVQGVKEELNYIPIWLYSVLCCHGNVKWFFCDIRERPLMLSCGL